jgi:ABC-type molybdate transport system substrate-binding protein
MVPVNSKQPEAAVALLKFLSSEEAAPIITRLGLKPLAKK